MGEQGAPAVQGSRPTAAETGDYGGTPACRGEEEQEQHRLNWEEEEQEEEDVSRSAEHRRAKGVKRWTGLKGGEHTSVHTYCSTGAFV